MCVVIVECFKSFTSASHLLDKIVDLIWLFLSDLRRHFSSKLTPVSPVIGSKESMAYLNFASEQEPRAVLLDMLSKGWYSLSSLLIVKYSPSSWFLVQVNSVT